MRHLSAVVAVVLLATTAAATERQLNLSPWGVLVLDLPAGWSLDTQSSGSPGGAAFRIQPTDRDNHILLVTPMPVMNGRDAKVVVREVAEQSVEKFRSVAVEKEIPLQPMDGPEARGFFVSVTDKTVTEPSSTQFKHADQGGVALGGVILTFTMFSNKPNAPERHQALGIIRTAKLSHPSPPPQSASGTVEVPAPGRKWVLELDLPGFELAPIQQRDDGSGSKLSGKRRSDGLVITAFIERAEPGKSSVDYREWAWSTLPPKYKRENVVRTERGSTAILEYIIHESEGMVVDQKHMNAYLVRDGMWIDVHLSKVKFVPEDAAKFEAILKTIRFTNGPSSP